MQYQTTVMPHWWMNRGVPAHLLLSHYLLNPGRGAQAKALSTNPRVSTPMILLRKVPTKGNIIPHLYNVKSKVSWFCFSERILLLCARMIWLKPESACFNGPHGGWSSQLASPQFMAKGRKGILFLCYRAPWGFF